MPWDMCDPKSGSCPFSSQLQAQQALWGHLRVITLPKGAAKLLRVFAITSSHLWSLRARSWPSWWLEELSVVPLCFSDPIPTKALPCSRKTQALIFSPPRAKFCCRTSVSSRNSSESCISPQ